MNGNSDGIYPKSIIKIQDVDLVKHVKYFVITDTYTKFNSR